MKKGVDNWGMEWYYIRALERALNKTEHKPMKFGKKRIDFRSFS